MTSDVNTTADVKRRLAEIANEPVMSQRIRTACCDAVDAIDKLQQQIPRWQSVQTPPPEDEMVLLWWNATMPPDVGIWTGKSWCRAYYDMGEYDAPPTQWLMPLLPAPEAT